VVQKFVVAEEVAVLVEWTSVRALAKAGQVRVTQSHWAIKPSSY